MQKIIIEVRGGVVVSVYGTEPETDVVIYDHDSLEEDDELLEKEKEIEKEIKSMYELY